MGRKCNGAICDQGDVRQVESAMGKMRRENAMGGKSDGAISDRIANICDAIKSHCKYL